MHTTLFRTKAVARMRSVYQHYLYSEHTSITSCAECKSNPKSATAHGVRAPHDTNRPTIKAAHSTPTEHRTREAETQETRRKKRRSIPRNQPQLLRRNIYSETYFTSLWLNQWQLVALQHAYAVSLSLANDACMWIYITPLIRPRKL